MRKKLNIATKKLEREILAGTFKPGDRLPAERALSLRYGVSRSILREGIRHLSSMGLVRTEAQSGTYVTDYRKEASLDFLLYLLDNNEPLDPELFRAINELREILESGCASRAAARSDPERVRALRSALAALRAEEGDPEGLAAKDYEFHALFVEQTDNLALQLLFHAFRSVYLFYVRCFYSDPESAQATFSQLECFLDRVEARDESGAAAALSLALAYGRDRVYRALSLDSNAPAISTARSSLKEVPHEDHGFPVRD